MEKTFKLALIRMMSFPWLSFAIIAVFIMITYEYTPAQVAEEWVVRYAVPGSVDNIPVGIAVDSKGNVYIGGYSGSAGSYDYTVVKYDSNGNRLWVAIYNGPGDGEDIAAAMALDPSGNVYVTGQSLGSDTLSDYATIKYDTNGKELWVARYNGTGNGEDVATGMALDASGNVYVTGGSVGSETMSDYVTIKYDGNGNELWVARYNGPGNGIDASQAVAIDPSGNVVVSGISYWGPQDDYMPTCSRPLTMKYDTNGDHIWQASRDFGCDFTLSVRAVAVDHQGKVYVACSLHNIHSLFEGFSIYKYDENGLYLWSFGFADEYISFDYPVLLALDASGNAYGASTYSNYLQGGIWYQDFFTFKYDMNDNRVWEASYNGTGDTNDTATALTVDSSGDVYVAGNSAAGRNNSGSDYAIVKYDKNGDQVWEYSYNGPMKGKDNATALAVDSLGNIYVTGKSETTVKGNYEFATIKLKPLDSGSDNGSIVWGDGDSGCFIGALAY
jgi:uncharacterized delta-60 repeat protein